MHIGPSEPGSLFGQLLALHVLLLFYVLQEVVEQLKASSKFIIQIHFQWMPASRYQLASHLLPAFDVWIWYVYDFIKPAWSFDS